MRQFFISFLSSHLCVNLCCTFFILFKRLDVVKRCEYAGGVRPLSLALFFCFLLIFCFLKTSSAHFILINVPTALTCNTHSVQYFHSFKCFPCVNSVSTFYDLTLHLKVVTDSCSEHAISSSRNETACLTT